MLIGYPSGDANRAVNRAFLYGMSFHGYFSPQFVVEV